MFCSCNAFAEGRCDNSLLTFQELTVLWQSPAYRKAGEGHVHLVTDGSVQQGFEGSGTVPKDALWHCIGLSPAPIVPGFCFTHLTAAGLGF